MNTPNRYHLWAALECHAFSKAEAVLRFSAEEDGMWVQWQDYARLKAEVERLRESGSSIVSILCQHVSDHNLRNLALREWNAAKEGKQP